MQTLIQILATLLFFAVFIMLFIALALYLGKTLYDFYKQSKRKKVVSRSLSDESDSVTLHISEGLLEVNRLDEQKEDH